MHSKFHVGRLTPSSLLKCQVKSPLFLKSSSFQWRPLLSHVAVLSLAFANWKHCWATSSFSCHLSAVKLYVADLQQESTNLLRKCGHLLLCGFLADFILLIITSTVANSTLRICVAFKILGCKPWVSIFICNKSYLIQGAVAVSFPSR